jgi:hypothetical protein
MRLKIIVIAERMAQRAKRKSTFYNLFLQRYALCAMLYALGPRATQLSGISLRRIDWKLVINLITPP